MGVFTVEVSVKAAPPGVGSGAAESILEREQWVDLSATVDTGAFLFSLPGSLLRSMEVIPSFTETVRMADGTTRDMDVGHVWLKLNGREVITLVAFNEDTHKERHYAPPVIGRLALGTLRLAVDPVGQRLFPMDSIPL